MDRSHLPQSLAALSSYLQSDVAKTVAALADAIKTSSDSAAAAAELCANAKTKKQRESLARAANLFALIGEMQEANIDLAELRAAIDAALQSRPAAPARTKKPKQETPAKKPSVSKKKSSHKTVKVPVVTAEQLLAELREAQFDPGRFTQVHETLTDSKRVKTDMLHHIANTFLAQNTAFKGRKEALEAILRRHHDLLRISDQDRMIERLN
ncbi:hypothetical protein [Hyphomicrobium sp. D-2]|uniref:hypothetical protein n=1 Tax=Hyphomicrobium sp. D-2 TaxID=3041621 RepID=UPI002457C2F8|nr:hypothetical protein [Hyphomicrobium sp. D-2]MDH4982480.1 hypothetical protein [Hyphomicrobium sp. D-2]